MKTMRSLLLCISKEIKLYFHEILDTSMLLHFHKHTYRNMFEYFHSQISQIIVSHAMCL